MSGGLFTIHRPVEITITPKGSDRADGMPSYDGEPVETRAWVTDKAGMLRKADGREIQYNRVFYVDRNEVVEVGDRILHDEKHHEVLSVSLAKDINGRVDHKKLLTGAVA